jgi:hypothetical protein
VKEAVHKKSYGQPLCFFIDYGFCGHVFAPNYVNSGKWFRYFILQRREEIKVKRTKTPHGEVVVQE